jgi:23S rRNA (cytidine2498-2'-O)-methyltransferase
VKGEACADQAWELIRSTFANLKTKPRLHLGERLDFLPGDEPLGFQPQAPEQEQRLRVLARDFFEVGVRAEVGDTVIDVVIVDPQEWWIGWHTHSPAHSPWPLGAPSIAMDPLAPSRAFLKLEESLMWSEAPLKKGDTALEIGSAPGGASYALLKRGLQVIGIDPGQMDKRVLAMPGFQHVALPVAQVSRESLPERIDWILLDMNVEPRISLFAVDRLVARTQDTLLGVLLTVKLNRWEFAKEIPDMIAHVKAMKMTRVKAAQLSLQRQEILIYGLSRKGQTRR